MATASSMTGVSGSQLLLIIPGLLVSLLGSGMVFRPNRVARFPEQMDAIGSKHPPAEKDSTVWNGTLSQMTGISLVIIGLYITLGGFGILPI